jgi:hypothetical protein
LNLSASSNLDAAGFWAGVVGLAAPTRRLAALVAELRLKSLDAGQVVVESLDPALAPVAQSRAPELEAIFSRVAGRALKLKVLGVGPRRAEGGAESGSGAGSEGGGRAGGESAAAVNPATSIHEHPLVKRAVEALGGRVVGVTPRASRAVQDEDGHTG